MTDVEEPVRVTGGFDFWIYGLHFGGAGLPAQWTVPLIARIPAAAERFPFLERECRLQAWVGAQGYPAPPLLELIPPGELFGSPVQVMQRVAGTRMDDAITAAPSRIPGFAGQLAASQVALHRLPVPDWARAGPGWSLADRKLQLPRVLAAQGLRGPLAEALDRAEQLVPLLEVPDPVICHGDFHPRNLLVDAGTVWVIDWTEAGIGDRHGDIARTQWLFDFAAVALTGEAGRAVSQALPALSRDYLFSYRRELPVDAARLRLWMPLQHLQEWAVAVAGQQGFFGPSRPEDDSRIAAWAEEQFGLSTRELP
ncbi:MAG TPA: phosphotransferase [Streptosporangiaceae bacterium]|nr:phosphotransferase [Streptosporangiaceae bacterium]